MLYVLVHLNIFLCRLIIRPLWPSCYILQRNSCKLDNAKLNALAPNATCFANISAQQYILLLCEHCSLPLLRQKFGRLLRNPCLARCTPPSFLCRLQVGTMQRNNSKLASNRCKQWYTKHIFEGNRCSSFQLLKCSKRLDWWPINNRHLCGLRAKRKPYSFNQTLIIKFTRKV